MSRLDRNIERVIAMRACLNDLMARIASVEGPIVELGLGNGRSFHHLREHMPNREIFVFERQPTAHPNSTPDESHLIVGDLEDTLPGALGLLPGQAALLHSDIGTGDQERNAKIARWLSTQIPGLVRSDGFVAYDQKLNHTKLEPLALTQGCATDSYII
ncbi:MAG: class I SAM-dependent methyltransferase, partial [Geminicoccaceae bacterium]